MQTHFDELTSKMVQLLEAFTSGSDHGEEAYQKLHAGQHALCQAYGWTLEGYDQRLESQVWGSSFLDFSNPPTEDAYEY
jgi:hypothetical protein